ncbi:MAG: hypothetical protein GTO63_33875, partial [Anaerolineae bacterium]|nr:hypothetical protein [Anaerolineae bacterium]NIN99624.1 hypothetical protein [Anaerolineae bacterium]NIQ82483.1 hypothetical protein [Anaerolineae bacterium]
VDALNGGFWGQPETKRHFKWFDALAGQHGYDLETMIRLCKMSPEEAFEEITDSLNDPIGDRLSNLRVTVRNEMRRLSECVKVIDKIG